MTLYQKEIPCAAKGISYFFFIKMLAGYTMSALKNDMVIHSAIENNKEIPSPKFKRIVTKQRKLEG